ncbi:MAG TPA: anti-sigma factor antagonist [Mycobacterium sp.]|nr:anti-sigma factor antagonist [Mycobacterium sp.]
MTAAVNHSFTPVYLSVGLRLALRNSNCHLRARAERCGSAMIVYAGGEVDASNAEIWQRLLREAAEATASPGPLVIDVSGLDFMGCCGYSSVAEEVRRCSRLGLAVRLVSDAPTVAKVVAACGLTELMPIYPDVDAALGRHRHACEG